MGESLNPSLVNRVSKAVRPDFVRTPAARRITAGLLVLSSAVLALRPDPGHTLRDVVIAARDLSPGVRLSAEDVALARQPRPWVPDGAADNMETVIGSTLAGPSRRGEVLTDARILGTRLTELSAGPDARVVPLHLADSAVLGIVRTGDVVDVLGVPAAETDANPRVVASNAVVVLVSPENTAAAAADDRVVLVALPASAANALAGATLVHDVTLTIH